MARTGLLSEQCQHAIGETDRGLVRGRPEKMIVAEVLHCLGRGLRELSPAVADVDAPEAGAEVDEIAALLVPDARAAAIGDDKRPVLEVVGDRGRGVEQALLVHLLEGEVARQLSHCVSPRLGCSLTTTV